MPSSGKIDKRSNFLTQQFLIDTLIISASWFGVFLFSNITIDEIRSPIRSILFSVIAVSSTLWMMHRQGLYQKTPSLPRTEEIAKVFVSTVTGAAGVTIFSAFSDWSIGATEILLGSAIVFQLRTLIRGLLTSFRSEILNSAKYKQKVTVVGAGREARELVNLIIDHPESQLDFCGVVGSLAVSERNGLEEYWIGPTSRLIDIMKRYDIEAAIVTTTGFRGDRFQSITQELFNAGFDVHLTTGISRMRQGRFEVKSLVHEPFVTVSRNNPSWWQNRAKRFLDIIIGTLALIAFSPLLLFTSIAIWLEDRGPVLYTADRVGRKGATFPMVKFRSMVADAEKLKKEMEDNNERSGPLFKLSDDPRITTVGRIIRETSIDELPQLLNVIRGDMSLVGPRPALPEETQDFDDELRKRTNVRPGITGLWQVEARSNEAFNAYRRLDLHYVENWTFWLDLRILLATAEQLAVAIALIPLRKIFKNKSHRTDGIVIKNSHKTMAPFMIGNIIDLTEPKTENLISDPSVTQESIK